MRGDLIKTFCGAFGTAEKPNNNCFIEYLNIGRNLFGYSGIESLSKVLSFNKTLRVLNLFHNLFDVNGARRLTEALIKNSTLEALDIGYNRIKDLGFENIMRALVENKNNNLRFLASRYNFIKSKTLSDSLTKILKGDTKIRTLEISNNGFDEKNIKQIYSTLFDKNEYLLKIDIFDLLYYVPQEKIDRTVWIAPLNYNESKYNILQGILRAERESLSNDNVHLGIPTLISVKRGRKTGAKKDKNCTNGFIEFIHPNSANRMLKLASTTGFYVNGKRIRAFKCGSKPEYLLVKKKEV